MATRHVFSGHWSASEKQGYSCGSCRPELGRMCLSPDEAGGKAGSLKRNQQEGRATKDGWTEFSKSLIPKTGQKASSLDLLS